MQTNPRRTSFAPLLAVLAGVVWLGTACTPSGPKALLQGEELIRKGKYEAAIEKLELATNLLPNEARAWNYLGMAHHRAGQYADARLAYERALKLDRDLAAARFNLGKMYMDQGVPISALEQLSTFVMLDQKSVAGWILMGDANLELLRYDQALENYYAALRLDRNLPAAYNGVGLIHMKRNNPREAYRFFVEALKHDSGFAPAILNLAVVLQTELDAKPLALAKYREYLAKAPEGTDLTSVRAAVRRLDEELNPPLEPLERPVLVASVDTNLTRVAEVEKTETSAGKPVVAQELLETESTEETVEKTVLMPPQEDAKPVAITEPEKTVPAKAVEKRTETAKAAAATNTPVTKVEKAEPKQIPVFEEPKTPVNEPVAKSETAPPINDPVVDEPEKPTDTEVTKLDKLEPKQIAGVDAPNEPVAKSESAPPRREPAVDATQPPEVIPEEAVDDLVEAVEGDGVLEVVQLEVEDIESPLEMPIAQETPSEQPISSDSGIPAEAPRDTSGQPLDSEPNAKVSEKKKGFFQRINPANLFRDDEEDPARSSDMVTPLPPSSSPSQPAGVASDTLGQSTQLASAGEYSRVTPMTSNRSPRRYVYQQSAPPSPGDRAASERLFQRGLDAQSQLDPGRAASFFASAAMADPSYFPAQYNLGLLSYQTGQTMKSLSAFETALALDPTSAEARYNFALALQKAKYPLDAVEELDRLLESYPDNLRAHLLLGNVYAQDLNSIERARSQYQTVLELDSKHPQAPAIRAWMKEHP